MGKSSNSQMKYPECNPMSYAKTGPALGSSTNTVNPYSFSKNGKSITNGKQPNMGK